MPVSCMQHFNFNHQPPYRTASNVGRPLIKVVTPWNIANDILRNVLIKSLIDYL